ncbi:MAG: erythromycin esterase family protein [Candidatus Sulfotelmatobacter sp.]
MTLLRWLLSFAILATLGASAPEPQTWIRDHAIPLRTVEAGHGFDDLQPLTKVVGDARIVALGEATHGTREFFQLKHRLIEFLASQKGFTIFSIEANMPEAYRLNDFVLNGNGDPKQLLKGLYFWTWDTEEVLNMILWMREFNRSGKGRIEFTGFDMQTPDVTMDVVRAFVKEHDPSYLDTLNRTYSDVVAVRKAEVGQTFGVATASFPVNLAAGHHIKYSGFIRTEGVEQGYAGLWWRTDGENGKQLTLDNMADRGAKGTTPWTRYEISLDVPTNATHINFGAIHAGKGTAWFDSLQVEIDGVPYEDTSLFDLDFESETPRGFYTGGSGYTVTLDKTVAHTGGQSLRSVARPQETMGKKQVAQACAAVVEELQAKRTVLLLSSKPWDADWAIQNARLLLQYMQLQTGEKSRDQSMAENVEWIAGQNPGAKIILWAHNGHVAQTAQYGPMGGYLHKKFGSQLVTFGFSFNEGSFRAIEKGKSLHDFKVGPAPEGSLDHALASAGLPLFALDLRQLPQQGPVAQWFAEPHDSRSIGAVYGGGQPESWSVATLRWPETFDVILFVENTSASRGNP